MTETAESVGGGDDVPLPDGAETGTSVDCPTCGTELEDADVDPPAADLAPNGRRRGYDAIRVESTSRSATLVPEGFA